MVIDKTTGRGCALSLLSKTVTEKLIADGIVDKPICRKHRKNRKSSKIRYDLFRVVKYEEHAYVVSQRSDEPLDEPLWMPSFIDAEVWTQAVREFPSFERLDQSVEKHLLPQMDEYLQGISHTELASLTRDFLIEHGIINKPISQRKGKTYYFNESEVYTLDKEPRLFPYEGGKKFRRFEVPGESCFNMRVWFKAVSHFEVGATLKDCIEIFLQTELVYKGPREPSPLDRLVQYIYPPVYERVPENKDKAVFDYIRMTVGLPRYQFNSREDLKAEVEKYQREIYQHVIQRLTEDCQFERYGVPLNFLKLSDVILRYDFALEFIFELKGQKISPLPELAEYQESL